MLHDELGLELGARTCASIDPDPDLGVDRSAGGEGLERDGVRGQSLSHDEQAQRPSLD